jgi:hypothetical protein
MTDLVIKVCSASSNVKNENIAGKTDWSNS